MRLAEGFDVIVSALESRAGGQYDMVMLHAICSLQVAQILMRLSNPQPLALSEASLSPRLGQNHNHNFDRRLSAKASFYLGRSGHRSLRVSVHSVSVPCNDFSERVCRPSAERLFHVTELYGALRSAQPFQVSSSNTVPTLPCCAQSSRSQNPDQKVIVGTAIYHRLHALNGSHVLDQSQAQGRAAKLAECLCRAIDNPPCPINSEPSRLSCVKLTHHNP